MTHYKKSYKQEVKTSLENQFLREAMDKFAVAYREGQKKTFYRLDKNKLVEDIKTIKTESISSIRVLYEKFKKKAEEKGVRVYLAKGAEDANRIIADIAKNRGHKNIAKSKSMTSEETQLNHYLEKEGLTVTETDLGEWIIQLRHEGPSHMVMPAIHLSRYQISELFSDVTKKNYNPENIDRLVKVARKELNEYFKNADMGITGANFLLADTATAGIVTNEGNARLVSTLPETHVILAGVDKLLPGMKEALKILKVLPKNATGQTITSYVTWITGKNTFPGNKEGKKDIHIVLLDNGRLEMSEDPEFSPALRCIRCGACANVCPVYRMVGGHTMGHIYIGAIGLILTFMFHGKQEAEKLIGNCIGCGACKDICAAGIDLPQVIRNVSENIKKETGKSHQDRLMNAVLTNRKLFHRLLKFARYAQKPFAGNNGFLRHLPLMFTPEHNFRSIPTIADRSFRDHWLENRYEIKKPKLRVALFSGCLQDFVYPEHLVSFVSVLKKNGIAVEFPVKQTCCGLPLMTTGNKDTAEKVALQNLDALEKKEYDYIITLCASCASFLKNGYVKLFAESDDTLKKKAFLCSEKIITSGEFIKNHIRNVNSPALFKGESLTFHTPCHMRELSGSKESAIEVLKKTGYGLHYALEEDTCCGFGGSYSGKFPEISCAILEKKLNDFTKTGAEIIATECPGCILQLRGGVDKKGLNIEVKHISELIS